MSSSKKSKSIRFSAGDVAENIAKDNVRHAGVHVKSTGVNNTEGDDEIKGNDLMRAPEDYAPSSLDYGNPALDEAMRDEMSMVAGKMYGQDKIGGVRMQNEAVPAYLKQLRAKNVTDKYYDLMMSAFDPLGKIL